MGEVGGEEGGSLGRRGGGVVELGEEEGVGGEMGRRREWKGSWERRRKWEGRRSWDFGLVFSRIRKRGGRQLGEEGKEKKSWRRRTWKWMVKRVEVEEEEQKVKKVKKEGEKKVKM